jgi:alanyl-tRNA synthetase
VEIWNLVFTEFERKEDGSMKPLPNRNIDTGMGLERIAAVLQGADTNFGTDLFVPIVERTAELIKGEKGRTPGESDLFLISDHVRAITFAIGDGVSPSNEGRGYVIRKLIRRAFLKSGQRVPFLYRLVNEVTFQMKAAYPLTHEKTEHISAIVKEEEARFSNTLDTAMPILEEIAASAKHELEGGKIFKLVDTYGLPFDVIREVAAKRGLELDTDGFREKMRERKEQSRKSSDISGDYIFKPDMFGKAPKPGFSDDMPLEADIEYIVKDGAGSADINKGEQAEIIISPQSSLFYCESGGQCGDTGSITGAGGRLRILNTLETDGRKVFLVKAEEGVLRKGDRIKLTLDTERKKKIARNHTATHLLQAALRQVLGEEVRQSGSSVDEEKLRFDFTHLQKVTDREKIRIEKKVNGWINEASSVSKAEKPIEEAKKEGALSFFGEKYGETVRVVSIPGRSKELCGGTHVKNTSEIGFFAIMSESSVASGIRRIEAATGEEAGRWLRGRISRAVEELKEGAEDPEKYIDKDIFSEAISIIEGKRAIDAAVLYDYEERLAPAFENASRKLRKEAKKRMKALQKESFEKVLGKLDEKLSEGTSGFVGAIFENTGMKTLRRAAKHVERTLDKGIAVLAGRDNGKAYLVCVRTGDVDEGPGADEIIKEAAAEIKGKGGGKAEFAQAGGNDPDGLERALEAARKIVTGKNS